MKRTKNILSVEEIVARLNQKPQRVADLFRYFWLILAPDKQFYIVSFIYSLVLSLLTLALPISVQALISSIANLALLRPVVILSIILLALLIFSGALYLVQLWLMEYFERRFFARITADITLRTLYGRGDYLEHINRAEMMNRYFEIMTVQKTLPSLLTGGFSLLLQTVVGLVVVSFYHPILLAFNIIFVLLVWIIWRVWSNGAVRHAIYVSEAKYKMASFLEETAEANNVFKSAYFVDFALKKSNTLSGAYLDARKALFQRTFAQNISFFLLYALASAGLLAFGGWLVIAGELTLGQLVATELIMSAIFMGIAKFGVYLINFYDLCAAVEKLSRFHRFPLENPSGRQLPRDSLQEVRFEGVWQSQRQRDFYINFTILGGEKMMISACSQILSTVMADLLRRNLEPLDGRITYNNIDLSECDAQAIRDRVVVLDDTKILEASIKEYFHIVNPNVTQTQITESLRLVDLDNCFSALPNGLDTMLLPSGDPLTASEILRLKLANVLLSKPDVIILTEIFDVLSLYHRELIFGRLQAMNDLTLVYFSKRKDVQGFDHYVWLADREAFIYDTIEELRETEARLQRTQG